MKVFKLIATIFLVCFQLNKAELVIIDRIVNVVSSEHGTMLITQSDLDRPKLSGEITTLEKLQFEAGVILKAQGLGRMATDDQVEEYLGNVMRENNISREDIRNLFKSGGYSYAEGFEQFRRMQTISNMVGAQVYSNINVYKKDVESYYQQNPAYTIATYTFERAVIHCRSEVDLESQLLQIKEALSKGDTKKFSWESAFTIQEDDFAENKRYLTALEIGGFSEPKEVSDGFEIFHLVAKDPSKLISLQDRYLEIVQILQKPKYQKLLVDYQNEIKNSVAILYLEPNQFLFG